MSIRQDQELLSRRVKLAKWWELGFKFYPAEFKRSHTVQQVRQSVQANEAPLLTGAPVKGSKFSVAGRLMTLRPHGSLWFANLQDETGSLQVALVQQLSSKQIWELSNNLDRGDIVGVTGHLVKTRRGELTILANELVPLAKALQILPEKWHGLKDVEQRLRHRYVDLMMSEEVRELFVKKSLFWQTVRQFLNQAEFMEVDTPALEAIAGGADANPFVTHHDALGKDFYLRISLELPLKRLLVGGFAKVFEIGKVFRNEGIDTEHLQDYTMCEFYWAYADYNDLMTFTQKLYQTIVQSVTGGLQTTYDGKQIDWSGNWPRKDYFEIIKEYSGVDLAEVTDVAELRKILSQHKIKYEANMGAGRLIDLFWKKMVRPKVIGPLFLVNHPLAVSPLAKRHRSLPGRVERMQIIAAGSELGNGFSELNDPQDQKERFIEQMKLRAGGDNEAMMLDDDFINALEYGMPPAAGFGFSERLFSFIMDKPIRETVLFPPMRDN